VRFQTASYSVPVAYAYREVIVKAYVDCIVICHKDTLIARHERSYQKNDFVFDPVHYLPLLERKPGALDGARPFTSWLLPDCFETLRRSLEAGNGTAGKREYVLILQLLRDFSVNEVRRAIEQALVYHSLTFESIKMLTVASREPSGEVVRLSAEHLARLPRVSVAEAQLSCYQALLMGGEV
jgi:hypothetical protein